jgi:hypothetical protein
MRTPHQCGAAMLARWVCVGCETVYCSRTDELCARSTWLNWIGSRHADRQRCADSDDEIAIAVLLMRNSVITGGIFRRPENATAVGETASICTSHFPPKSPPTGSVPYFLAATSFARSSRSVQSGRSDGSIHPAAPTRPHRRARTLVRVARDLEGLPIAVLTGNRRKGRAPHNGALGRRGRSIDLCPPRMSNQAAERPPVGWDRFLACSVSPRRRRQLTRDVRNGACGCGIWAGELSAS